MICQLSAGIIWQVSQPYLNQRGQIMPPTFLLSTVTFPTQMLSKKQTGFQFNSGLHSSRKSSQFRLSTKLFQLLCIYLVFNTKMKEIQQLHQTTLTYLIDVHARVLTAKFVSQLLSKLRDEFADNNRACTSIRQVRVHIYSSKN